MAQVKVTFSGAWQNSYSILAGYAQRYGISPGTLARMLLVPALKQLHAGMIERNGQTLSDGTLIQVVDLFEQQAQEAINAAEKTTAKRAPRSGA